MENISTATLIPAKLAKAAKPFKLSPRQLEVVALKMRGEPQKGIAEIMGITTDGVQFHMRRIFSKLKVQSSMGAVGKIFLEA
jgi:DNA-binding CsgD family transcriptional regulator